LVNCARYKNKSRTNDVEFGRPEPQHSVDGGIADLPMTGSFPFLAEIETTATISIATTIRSAKNKLKESKMPSNGIDGVGVTDEGHEMGEGVADGTISDDGTYC